ncbi:MAG: hypothetical protein HY000_33025 [Planctomycetes bacterium]|nr:hypothetical protein [Planctomycetota bacterium]
MTAVEEEFGRAEALVRAGNTDAAIGACTRLKIEYRGSWIDRVASERLRNLRDAKDKVSG